MFRSLPFVVRLVLARVGLLLTSGDRRDAEILALRHQLLVLQRQVPKPTFDDTDRTVLGVLSQVFNREHLAQVFLIVPMPGDEPAMPLQPATVLDPTRSPYTWPAADSTGDPPACLATGQRESDVGLPPCAR